MIRFHMPLPACPAFARRGLLLVLTAVLIGCGGCKEEKTSGEIDFPKTILPPSADVRGYDPIWSPDGKEIYFGGNDSTSGAQVVFSYSLSDGVLKKRFDTAWGAPRWRNGTSQIVAMQRRLQAFFNVFDTETGEVRLMGDTTSEFHMSYQNHKYDANFVPGTDTLYFTYLGSQFTKQRTGLYEMDLRVGKPVFFAEMLEGILVPNTPYIVGRNDETVSSVNNHGQIIMINRFTKEITYLTEFSHNPKNGADRILANLSPSPDGKMVIVNRGFELWLIQTDGTGAERLSNVEQSEFGFSSWAPNCQEFVAEINIRPQVGDESTRRLYVYNLKTKAFRPLFPKLLMTKE